MDKFDRLPKETSTEPVQAWKLVRMRQRPNGRLIMSGVHLQTMHPVEGDAVCLDTSSWRNSSPEANAILTEYCSLEGDASDELRQKLRKVAPHSAPNPECRCGFYAWKDRALMIDYAVSGYPDLVPVRVELWGRVLQYERGYRAEHQRVLGIYLPPACSNCKTTDGVSPQLFREGYSGYGFLHMLCMNCTKLLAFNRLCGSIGFLRYESTWSLGDVAGNLGCEASLLENTPINVRRVLSSAARDISRAVVHG